MIMHNLRKLLWYIQVTYVTWTLQNKVLLICVMQGCPNSSNTSAWKFL